jgi:hypothetical protein
VAGDAIDVRCEEDILGKRKPFDVDSTSSMEELLGVLVPIPTWLYKETFAISRKTKR